FIIAGVFLLPSTLFWCSGIHKDGLILSAIGIVIYCFNKGINKRFTPVKVAVIALSLVLIFSLRNYIAIIILPALFCWYLTVKEKPAIKPAIFMLVFWFGAIAFFSAKYISPKLDFPAYVVEKQSEFAKLEGTSSVKTGELRPDFAGFVRYFPDAIDMAFLRPHLTEAKNFSYIPAALENLFFIIIVVFVVFKGRKKWDNPVILFCLTLSIFILLIAGYTITLSGAIVRYRSITLPFLITPLLCLIDFKKTSNKNISVT
ncbi:MAG TPA: hypothetical protein VF623_12505, partial [Segetibacter sp.]